METLSAHRFLVAAFAIFLSQNAIANQSCQNLFVTGSGIIEKRILNNNQRLKSNDEDIEPVFKALDKGGNDWTGFSSTLMDQINDAVTLYNSSHYDNITNEKIRGLAMIKSALQNSKEFTAHDEAKINQLADSIANYGRHGHTPNLGAKHILYQALYDFGIAQSPELKKLLLELQDNAGWRSRIRRETQNLEMWLNTGLKGISNLGELKDRLTKIEADINQVSRVPDDVINALVPIAEEYNGNNGGWMTAGDKIEKLVKGNRYFVQFSEREIDNLRWNYKNAITTERARSILSQIHHTPGLESMNAERESLMRAIEYFDRWG